MRKILKSWLGITAIEAKLTNMYVALMHLSPEQAEEVMAGTEKKNYKLINEHGDEGKL